MRYVRLIKKHTDKRGDLVEFLKATELKDKKFGQIYFVTFDGKGVVRGNHYHKRITEWFGIVVGEVRVNLYDLKTKKWKSFFLTAGDKKYRRLKIPAYTAHAFRSISDYAVLLNYSDKLWRPSDRCEFVVMPRVFVAMTKTFKTPSWKAE